MFSLAQRDTGFLIVGPIAKSLKGKGVAHGRWPCLDRFSMASP
jgi:hypothetical protein